MRRRFVCLALLAVAPALHAAEPTDMGGGVYMLTDQNFTVFGSPEKIAAKLTTQAHAFCKERTGQQAHLLAQDGTDAQMGTYNDSGRLQRGARGATGTIHFSCTPPREVRPRAVVLDELREIKSLLDAGALTQDEYDAMKKQLMEELSDP